jgi:gluconate 2-dehydrogenase gamma chain
MHDEGRGEGRVSRATLLKRAGVLGAVAAVPGGALVAEAARAPERERLEALTATEADALGAMLDRLIPSDAAGPGAREARVLRYVDRALAGELASDRDGYAAGLAAVDDHARSRFGGRLADLAAAQQDTVLRELEQNTAAGFAGGSRAFFDLVREHALQGMFGDPFHGGNADFAGWDLIGFTGIKLEFTEAEQQLDVRLVPAHKSTVDYPLFSGARGKGDRHGHH